MSGPYISRSDVDRRLEDAYWDEQAPPEPEARCWGCDTDFAESDLTETENGWFCNACFEKERTNE